MNETYYLNSTEISVAIDKYTSSLSNAQVENGDTKLSLDDFMSSSSPLLVGDTWDGIRKNLKTYSNYINLSSDISDLICEANIKCLKMVLDFLGTEDSELDTSRLPEFTERKATAEAEIAALRQENAELKAESERTEKKLVTTVDGDGNPKEEEMDVPVHTAEEIAGMQAQIDENNARIDTVLQPEVDEMTRLIDKINKFYDEILPLINAELADAEAALGDHTDKLAAIIKSTLNNYDLRL